MCLRAPVIPIVEGSFPGMQCSFVFEKRNCKILSSLENVGDLWWHTACHEPIMENDKGNSMVASNVKTMVWDFFLIH